MLYQKIFISICLCLFGYQFTSQAQSIKQEKAAIFKQARAFSKAYVEENIDKIMELYTKDASVFPNRTKILSGSNAVRKYWSFNPQVNNISHKLMPKKVEIVGNTAYDYGYYEGVSEYKGKKRPFYGKYVVVWKKVQGIWKMHLDIWNSVQHKKE